MAPDLNPSQIMALTKSDPQLAQLISDIRAYYHTSVKNKKALMQAIGQKLTAQLSNKQGIDMSQSAAVIFLDGFWDWAHTVLKRAPQALTKVYQKYRQPIHAALTGAVATRLPFLAHMVQPALHFGQDLLGFKNAIGGKLKKQDPYAMQPQTIIGLSGITMPHHIGRKTDHLLSQFKDLSTYPVSTGATGQALVIISPQRSFSQKATIQDASYFTNFPYYYCSSASNTAPFSAVQTVNNFAGPYYDYINQTLGTASDATIVQFASLQSALYAKGRIHCSVFTQAPNQTWTPVQTVTDQLAYRRALSISLKQMTNNKLRYCKRNIQQFLSGPTFLGRLWDQTYSDIQHIQGGNNPHQTRKFAPTIILWFQGCTSGTTIGQITVKNVSSFQPIGSVGNIFNQKSRGTYQGQSRLFKQMMSNQLPVNFIQPQLWMSFVSDNFAQVNVAQKLQSKYQGTHRHLYIPQGRNLLVDPTQDCQQIIFQMFGLTGQSRQQVINSRQHNICIAMNGQLVQLRINDQAQQLIICFDHGYRHVYVVGQQSEWLVQLATQATARVHQVIRLRRLNGTKQVMTQRQQRALRRRQRIQQDDKQIRDMYLKQRQRWYQQQQQQQQQIRQQSRSRQNSYDSIIIQNEDIIYQQQQQIRIDKDQLQKYQLSNKRFFQQDQVDHNLIRIQRQQSHRQQQIQQQQYHQEIQQPTWHIQCYSPLHSIQEQQPIQQRQRKFVKPRVQHLFDIALQKQYRPKMIQKQVKIQEQYEQIKQQIYRAPVPQHLAGKHILWNQEQQRWQLDPNHHLIADNTIQTVIGNWKSVQTYNKYTAEQIARYFGNRRIGSFVPGTLKAPKGGDTAKYMLTKQGVAQLQRRKKMQQIVFGLGNKQLIATKNKNKKIGSGKYYQLQQYKIAFNPKRQGFCVYDSLNFMGIHVPYRPWYTVSQILNFKMPNLILMLQGKVVNQFLPIYKYYLAVDISTQHAFVLSNIKFVQAQQPLQIHQQITLLSVTMQQNTFYQLVKAICDSFQITHVRGHRNTYRPYIADGKWKVQVDGNQMQTFDQQNLPILQSFYDIFRTYFDKISFQLTIVQQKIKIAIRQDDIMLQSSNFKQGVFYSSKYSIQTDQTYFKIYQGARLVSIFSNVTIKDLQRVYAFIPILKGQFYQSSYQFLKTTIGSRKGGHQGASKTLVSQFLAQNKNNYSVNALSRDQPKLKSLLSHINQIMGSDKFQQVQKQRIQAWQKQLKKQVKIDIGSRRQRNKRQRQGQQLNQNALKQEKKNKDKQRYMQKNKSDTLQIIQQKVQDVPAQPPKKLSIQQLFLKVQKNQHTFDHKKIVNTLGKITRFFQVPGLKYFIQMRNRDMKLQLLRMTPNILPVLYMQRRNLAHGLLHIGYQIVDNLQFYAKLLRLYLTHTIDVLMAGDVQIQGDFVVIQKIKVACHISVLDKKQPEH